MITEQTKDRINQQAAAMIEDCREHLAECRAYGGPDVATADERVLFEAWAIQKIAGLQVLVMDLADRLAGMETDSRLTAKTDSRQRPNRSRRVQNRPNLSRAKNDPAASVSGGKP